MVDTRKKIDQLNRERKLQQTSAGMELRKLEDEWATAVRKNLEISMACERIEEELVMLQAQLGPTAAAAVDAVNRANGEAAGSSGMADMTGSSEVAADGVSRSAHEAGAPKADGNQDISNTADVSEASPMANGDAEQAHAQQHEGNGDATATNGAAAGAGDAGGAVADRVDDAMEDEGPQEMLDFGDMQE